MTKTAIEMVIEEYEGHLERLIKQRSQRLQNGQRWLIPMIDRRIAEYQEIIARLRAPSVLSQIRDTIDRELNWYNSHTLSERLKGAKAAYQEMDNFIKNLCTSQQVKLSLTSMEEVDEVIDTLNQWIDQRAKQRKTETRSYLIDRSDSAIGTLNSVISLLKRIKNRK